jgi:ribosome-associated protein
MTQRQRGLQQACLAARALDDFRGQDTIVLDLTGITPIVDYFVVTTGTSSRQMRAMAEEVHRVLKQEGSKRIGLEGAEGSSWILQDYGDIVIHIFTGEGRDLYDLERLWGDAPRVDWKSHCPPTPRPQAAASEPRSEPADVQPTDAEPTTND